MKLEVKINPDLEEPIIEIHTNEVTEEIERILKFLKVTSIQCFNEDKVFFVESHKVSGFTTQNTKVYAIVNQNLYLVKQRLFELETLLCNESFIRISNSEIVNVKKIEFIDLTTRGTIKIKLKDGYQMFASRRYVSKIKKQLNVK